MKQLRQLLIVEDSKIQAIQIRGLLEEAGYAVDVAENGVVALEKIGVQQPDLVITDLQMPEMDGLELVEAIRSEYPELPVVLVTARGSEVIAVEALKRGAASYVPKVLLAQQLVRTVKEIAALMREHSSGEELFERMTFSQLHFTLENSEVMFSSLVAHLQNSMAALKLFDETGLIRVGLALTEALENAMYYGNLEVAELLVGSDMSRSEAVKQRRDQSPYCDRHIFVEAKLSRDDAQFCVRNEGPGFDSGAISGEVPEDFNHPSRGVMLMKSLMDDVTFNDSGNEVRLVKQRASS